MKNISENKIIIATGGTGGHVIPAYSLAKDLIKKALDQSKKNYSVQRYKGLGEMNPDQLWQTTLDPEYRSILRVDIDDAQRADDVFEELMGDDVEKRKVFIQSNAKKVSNLDV